MSRYVSDLFSLLVFDTFPLCFEPLLGCMLIFFPPPLHTPTHIRVCNYTLQLTRCLDEARDGTTVGASGGLITPSPTYENSGGIVEPQHNVQLARAQPMLTPQTQPLRSSLCEFCKNNPCRHPNTGRAVCSAGSVWFMPVLSMDTTTAPRRSLSALFDGAVAQRLLGVATSLASISAKAGPNSVPHTLPFPLQSKRHRLDD